MGDDVEATRIDPVGIRQQGRGGARHDDRGVNPLHQLDEDRALVRRRVTEDGVEGGDRRHVQRADEVQHGRAVIAAPDAVLVLDGDHIDAATQRSRDTDVVGGLVAADPVMDLGRVAQHVCRGMQRDDLAIAGRASQVSGEGGDAAAAGWVGGDECGADDSVLRSMAARGARAMAGDALMGSVSDRVGLRAERK